MTADLAQKWFSQQKITLPALTEFQNQAIELGEDNTSTLAQMADIICLDPGMSMTLFQQINGRLEKSGRHRMDSIHNALSVLSDIAIQDFVRDHKSINIIKDEDCRQEYRQLVSRSQHLLAQLTFFAKIQGLAISHDFQIAALLYNCGEMIACIADYPKYRDYLLQFRKTADADEAAIQAFGFSFNELGHILTDYFFLPELVAESFVNTETRTRKAELIQHAASISKLAELGWGNESTLSALKNCQEYIAPESQDFEKQIHQTTILAARKNKLLNVRLAAINLFQAPVLDEPESSRQTQQPSSSDSPSERQTPKFDPIKAKALAMATLRQKQLAKEQLATKKGLKPDNDKVQAGSQKPTIGNVQKPVDASSYGPELKAILTSEQANQAQLITHLFKFLRTELYFSETALLLLSPDKKKLVVKLTHGYGDESEFPKLTLETARSGLFLNTLKKQTAFCLTSANYEKYASYLPAAFRMTNNARSFVIMPIYAEKKPLGIVYCSLQNSDRALDNTAFAAFKSVITLANKGLAFLIQKKRKKAA